MKNSVVAGFKGCAFRGVDFGRYVTLWEDTRTVRVAHHEYNKRDGGEAEKMGRKAHECRIHLAFVGPKWLDAFLQLQAAIDEEPVGTLTHPVYGPMNAACLGGMGRMDVENAPNFYDVNLQFRESAVDTKVQAGQATNNPADKQQLVTTKTTNLATAIALYASSARSAVAALNEKAIAFADAAIASFQGSAVDASLPLQLDGVRVQAGTALTAASADPAPVDLANVLALIEEVYDACAQLDDVIRAQRPSLELYVIPTTTNLTNLARLFYGRDAATRESEILANNPGKILDPGFISPGTTLILAQRTFTP